jgi:hypothetical protein
MTTTITGIDKSASSITFTGPNGWVHRTRAGGTAAVPPGSHLSPRSHDGTGTRHDQTRGPVEPSFRVLQT